MQKKYIFWSQKKLLLSFSILLVLSPLLVISLSDNVLAACITYSSSSKTISITCTSTTHLTTVNSVINNANILKKESTGIWLLSANLVIAKGANLVIDSTDGTWLKIRSDGSAAYGLKNSGTLTVDSFKITSWNTATNNYASPGSSGQTLRGYIATLSTATGKTNILNSELAYLGYSGSGTHGLDYYGGAGSLIQNNQIHHLWRAFYSSGIGGITFTKNVVHDSLEYGIDPHSGTHDMYITYNKAYNNNHGIICSVACYNMHITNNELYNNQRDGIFMDAGSHHSTIANNIIHDEDVAIQLPSLSYSEVYGNTITNSKYGIEFETQIGSSFDRDGRCVPYGCVSINNNVHDNHVKATSIGLWAKDGASSNTFSTNTIDGLNGDRGIVVDGSKTSNNIFSGNHISNAKYSIRVTGGNTNSKFINNHLDTVAASGEYTLSSASALKLESTVFSADIIRALDSSSIPISISKSGVISVVDGSTTKTYDTNSSPYTKTLTNGGKIKVTTSSLSTAFTASTTSLLESNTTTAPDQRGNSSMDKTSAKTVGTDNNGLTTNGSEYTKALQLKSAQQQANLAEEQAKHQLGNSLKGDGEQPMPSETREQNDGQGTRTGNIEATDSNLPGSDVTRDNNPDNPHSDNRGKGLGSTPKLPSVNDDKIQNHETFLNLRLRPGDSPGKYILTGNLWDKIESSPLQGMKIFFTVEPLVKISDQITNKAGAFNTNLLIAPGTGETFKIQAHFGKFNHYDATDSKIITFKMKNEKSNILIENPDFVHPALPQKRSDLQDGIRSTNNSTYGLSR